jgi:hypothetical protein
MILHCSFEELRALRSGAELALASSGAGPGAGCAVAAPADLAAQIDLLLPRLTGDLSVSTLAEQRRLRDAVALISDNLRARMEGEVVEHHPGHEDAVTLYFDYAHVLKVLDKLDRMGEEMSAMIEVVTGQAAGGEAAASFTFPD